MKKFDSLCKKTISYKVYDYKYNCWDSYTDSSEIIKLKDLNSYKVDAKKYSDKKDVKYGYELLSFSQSKMYYEEQLLRTIINKEDFILECKGESAGTIDVYEFIPFKKLQDDLYSFLNENFELHRENNVVFENLLGDRVIKAKYVKKDNTISTVPSAGYFEERFGNIDAKKREDYISHKAIDEALRVFENTYNLKLSVIYAEEKWLELFEKTSRWINIYIFNVANVDNPIFRIQQDSPELYNLLTSKFPTDFLISSPNMSKYTFKENLFCNRISLVLGAFKKVESKKIF